MTLWVRKHSLHLYSTVILCAPAFLQIVSVVHCMVDMSWKVPTDISLAVHFEIHLADCGHLQYKKKSTLKKPLHLS